MPNRLMAEVGAGTVEFPLKGTAALIRATFRRFAIRHSLNTGGGTDAEVGQAVLKHLAIYVRDGSIDQDRQDIEASQAATLAATLLANSDLVDEELP